METPKEIAERFYHLNKKYHGKGWAEGLEMSINEYVEANINYQTNLSPHDISVIRKKVDEWDDSEAICRAVEECNELATDLLRHKRGRITVDKLKEEIADVRIVLAHLEYRFGSYQEQLDVKLNKCK